MIKETFDYTDYLSAKKSIDDLSLNQQIWSEMAGWLKARQHEARPVHIIELGAGIGTMIERLLEANLLMDCVYTAIELEAPFHQAAFNRLASWSALNHYQLEEVTKNKLLISNANNRIELEWITGDILDTNIDLKKAQQDLLIGHAIIDLLPVPDCMPALLNYLKPRGGFYFSLNFAGQTQFQPLHPLDMKVSEAYHQDMDKRFPGLDWVPSKTGLNLGPWLISQGHNLIAEGPSDWNLVADTKPENNSRLFISNILDTIAKALNGMPGLDDWLEQRHRQLNKGELQLMVTNRDCFGITGG